MVPWYGSGSYGASGMVMWVFFNSYNTVDWMVVCYCRDMVTVVWLWWDRRARSDEFWLDRLEKKIYRRKFMALAVIFSFHCIYRFSNPLATLCCRVSDTRACSQDKRFPWFTERCTQSEIYTPYILLCIYCGIFRHVYNNKENYLKYNDPYDTQTLGATTSFNSYGSKLPIITRAQLRSLTRVVVGWAVKAMGIHQF